MIELRAESRKRLNSVDPAYQYLGIVDRFTLFRSSINDGTMVDSGDIIDGAMKFDAEILEIFENVPPEWLYETVYDAGGSKCIYDGVYNIYYDYWIAQIWNSMRTVRMMLHEVILQQLFIGLSTSPLIFANLPYTTQFHLSTSAITKMRDDILRSVPQHIGYVTRNPYFFNSSYNQNPSTTSTTFDDPFSTLYPSTPLTSSPPVTLTPPSNPSTIGGYFLLWPLFVCGRVRINTPQTFQFIVHHLDYISSVMGIQQGATLAAFLIANRRTDMSTWGPGTQLEDQKERFRKIMARPGYLAEMMQNISKGSEGNGVVGVGGFTDEYVEARGQNEGLL